jgi:3-phenylpropionate/cinnamic acid dioxygenase small subunit
LTQQDRSSGAMDLLRSVEAFLFHEAALMDAHRYDDWLSLWRPEALYWVPTNDDATDPDRTVNLLYERMPQMEDRLNRLKGKHAFAQSPKSRLIRVISNIVIDRLETDGVTVSSAFAVGEWRPGTETHWFGRTVHQLVHHEDAFAIREKKVMLLNNRDVMRNLQFLI